MRLLHTQKTWSKKLFAQFVRRDVCLFKSPGQTKVQTSCIHFSSGDITEDDLPEERGRGEGAAVGRPHR
jgi:hypothetical protein